MYMHVCICMYIHIISIHTCVCMYVISSGPKLRHLSVILPATSLLIFFWISPISPYNGGRQIHSLK